MRFRFPLSWPNRADDAIVPAALSGVLVISLVVQFAAVGQAPDLPPILPVTSARMRITSPAVGMVVAPPAIFQRPLFAPRSAMRADVNSSPTSMLGGAIVAGTVSVSGHSYAVVRRSDGIMQRLSVGGTLAGWRLAALRDDGAVFVKGRERRNIAFGASPMTVPDAGAAE